MRALAPARSAPRARPRPSRALRGPRPTAPRRRSARSRPSASAADARLAPGSPSTSPVVVLGASGRTGGEVVRRCVSLGIPVRACSRAPIDPAALLGEAAASAIVPWSSPLVTLVDGVDVARSSSEASSVGTPAPSPSDAALAAAVAGARLVVFAATASASGDPNAVDHLGCAATARACVAAGVPRLVLVSGAGVTRRASDAYRFLNLFGRRMDAKVAGEAALRAVFREASRGSGSFSSKKRVGDEEEEGGERGEPRGPAPSYTIVRPSGLLDGPGRGPAALATNQGDVAAGFIDRADVAACCVAAGLSGACAGCTFEVYAAGTAVSAETLAVSDILSDPAARRVARALEAAANRRTKGEREGGDDAVTARERRGGDWETLFEGLVRDEEAEWG